MIGRILSVVWICLVVAGASYATAIWKSSAGAPEKPPVPENAYAGLEYRSVPVITVPMITEGAVDGYVVAKFEFTANATAAHDFPMDLKPFLSDEAFRQIYSGDKINFRRMSKYNIDKLTEAIKKNVNERLGGDFIHDVLVVEINYVDKAAAGKAGT